MVGYGFECAGDLQITDRLIDDDREAKSDRSRARGDDNLVQRAECIDECGDAFLCISKQIRKVAGLNIAEDKRSANRDSNNMNHGGHVMAKRDNAKLKTHFDALLRGLLDAIADHEGQNAFGLVVLYDFFDRSRIVRFAEHDGDARNVARDERNAERTNDRIRHKADAAFGGIGVAAADILQAFDDLRADRCRKAGIQRLSDVVLVRDQALQHADTGRQIAELLYFDARRRINCREEVRCIGESDGGICAMLCDGIVDSAFSQARNCIGTGVDEISQCAHICLIPPNQYFC